MERVPGEAESHATRARRRLQAPWEDQRLSAGDERTAISRNLAFLFGFGGLLLWATLALPGAAERDAGTLAVIGLAALVFSGVLLVGVRRLPFWFLALAPGFGSVLVGLVIGFAGPEASAAYALYFAWVLIAAANYLSRAATALHGAFAVVVYALAIQVAGAGPAPTGLRLAMVAGTAVAAAVVMARLASEVRDFVGRLEDDALTDPLTGLDNRRSLREQFERELARADRTGRPMALLSLDLDEFKRFNDARGHPAGDDALRRLASILDEVTRAVEIVARIGGEEFAIVAPDTDRAGALALGERVRIAVESEFSQVHPPLTVSCGIAVYRPGGRAGDQLITLADRALYAAKSAGRNRVELAPESPVELAGSEQPAQAPAGSSAASSTK